MFRKELPDGQLQSQPTPVIVFTGPRAAGKTELTTWLRDRVETRYPFAFIDGNWPFDSTADMLLLLAFQLNRKNDYGTLSFPRLITGEIVISANLTIDLTNPEAARRRIEELLAEKQKTKAALADTITTLSQGLGQSIAAFDPAAAGIITATLELVTRYGVSSLLGRLGETRHGRTALFGRGLNWWERQDGTRGRAPIDQLIELRQDADRARPRPGGGKDGADQEGDKSAGQRVTRQLWAAFLADLRESFADRKRAANWTRNCVLLLDNADTTRARSFLEELVNARGDREGEHDPLTVVTTSRGGLTQPVRLAGLTPLATASRGHYLKQVADGASPWWYPVFLRPLSWKETSDRIADLRLPGADAEALATMAHGFTRGHPGTTRLLVRGMADQPQLAAELSLPALLAAPEARSLAERERSLEDAMLHRLLGSLGDRNRAAADDLATCAAARHREEAVRLATNLDLMAQLRGEGAAIFASEFWCGNPGSDPAVMYQPLRRLLLSRLAARPPEAKAEWGRVHAWLRHRARLAGKDVAELYHTLALAGTPDDEVPALVHAAAAQPDGTQDRPGGEPADPLTGEAPLAHVARQLADRFGGTDAGQWLELVASVAAAPNRLDQAKELRRHVTELTLWADHAAGPAGRHRVPPMGAVARYLTYCWLGADTVCAPHWGWLLHQMASELDLLAPDSDDKGLSLLRAEAKKYRETADRGWRDIEHFWMSRAQRADETNWEADR